MIDWEPKRRVTREEINAAKSPRGAWTATTLALWGVPWPPPKGWAKRLETFDGPCPERAARLAAKREETRRRVAAYDASIARKVIKLVEWKHLYDRNGNHVIGGQELAMLLESLLDLGGFPEEGEAA